MYYVCLCFGRKPSPCAFCARRTRGVIFPPSSLPKPFSWQLSTVLCSLMTVGRKWMVSVWGFSCAPSLYYCLVAYLLPSSVYSSGIGSSLSRDWLFCSSCEHSNAWSMIDASKLCCEAVSTHLTWWKILLAHEGSDMKVTTEIRSETICYRWLTGEQENQPSVFQKRSHCKPSPPHLAIIFTSSVAMGQSLCITLHTLF